MGDPGTKPAVGTRLHRWNGRDRRLAPGTRERRRPRLHLSIGVTGHRPPRLSAAGIAPLQAALVPLLEHLTTVLRGLQRRHSRWLSAQLPCHRLVSALAEGADSLAAEAALELGWQLDACLPFPPDDYAVDFGEGPALSRFQGLLARAEAVFALPGQRDAATAAYEAVGRVVLDQADILLAIWDGDPARGRGGTAQIVAEAVARHIPVIHLDPAALAQPGTGPQLLWTGLSDLDFEQPTLDTVPRAPVAEVLESVLEMLTAPPGNPVDVRMLRRFYRERIVRRTPALPWPLLLAMTGVRRMHAADLAPPRPVECAQGLGRGLGSLPPTGGHSARLSRILLPRFGLSDAAATYFAQLFRSGYVANFALAAVAVLLALSGLVVPGLKSWLIGTELLVIMLILANTRLGTRAGWHERWMDNRHLAEQLRTVSVSSLLGDLALRDAEADSRGVAPGWVRWYARATARELGLPHAIVDAGYLQRVRGAAQAMIDDQAAYHRDNARRMHQLDHRLHRLGGHLFALTAMACLAWIAVKLAGLEPGNLKGLDVTLAVTVMTAVLPALGAALYGIRMQGDFGGVADRSLTTAARLEALQRDIAGDPDDFGRLQARLRRLSDVMLADIAHWRTTYQARPLSLPG
ncbi:hypothetical protein [Marilutibacter aestuarii]|uniref:DUF4231 domain-containing protein n=1 Tax=Marilutibacter aestuarii TaxID=1706195 RepID=A0A508A743_9GAMM|nr:hypothetical protein [Lysobacter aestuarii]TQD45207.1 hypothetical protein FKV25_09045 [Lysobacter aestuarii]